MTGGGEQAGNGGDGAWPTYESSLSCCRDLLIWPVMVGQGGAVSLSCLGRILQDGLAGRATTPQSLGDPFSLQRVDEAGGIADKQHPAIGWRGPDDAHLEPASEAPRRCQRRRIGKQAKGAHVLEERRERSNRLGPGLTVGAGTEAEADVDVSSRTRKHPAITGKGVPRCRLPQNDGGELDRVRQVRAHRESPQDLGRLDQAGCGCDTTGGSVGTNHEIGAQLLACAQPISVDAAVLFQWLICPPKDRGGPGIDSRFMEHRVEDVPGDGLSVPRISEPLGTRKPDPATGGPDHQHGADVRAGRLRYSEIGQYLQATGADQIATCLVAGKVDLSTIATRAPPFASTKAAILPAGPPPITSTSKRDGHTLPPHDEGLQ